MNAIILEDELPVAESLKGKLALFCPEVTVLEICQSVADAQKAMATGQVDLIFLDVNLHGETGFDLIDSASSEDLPSLIFTTAHDEYALRAIKSAAVDYLLKPIDAEELVRAIRKLQNQKGQTNAEQLQVLRQEKEAPKKLVIPTSEGMHVLNISDIMRCESSSNYTQFFLRKGKSILASKTMKEFESLLTPAGFERIHKSHLVNMDTVKRFVSNDGGYVILEDGSQIPVSVRKRERLLSYLKSL